MVKEVGAEIERLDLEFSDAMTEAECERFSCNGSTFYLSSRLYASPIAGQKEAMFAALKSNGFGEIVAETVNANTLASFVKEQRELNNDEYLRSIESEEEQNYSFIDGNKNNVKKKMAGYLS